MTREQLNSFLTEYEKLCKKHNAIITACGCCNSPGIIEIEVSKFSESLETHMDHLSTDPWQAVSPEKEGE